MSKALLVIDVQKDYFQGGALPLWNAEATLENVVGAIQRAKERGVAVVLVQHVADPDLGEIHPRVRAAAAGAPVVAKRFADGFHETELEATLRGLGVTELFVCGMMTQNCVTHTAISKAAEKYDVAILSDGCTTLNELVHKIALRGVSTRTRLVSVDEAF